MHVITVLILLSACVIPATLGLYEDQIGKFDWIQRGIGNVVLAEFESSSSSAETGQARRLVVATEQNVLAMFNTKNREIAWRHVFESGSLGKIETLRVRDGDASVVTGNPPLLRVFDLHTAALVRETQMMMPFKFELEYGKRLVHESDGSITVAHLTEGAVELIRFSSTSGTKMAQQHTFEPWITNTTQCELSSTVLVCADASLGLLLSLPLNKLPTNAKDQGAQFTSVSLQSVGVTVPAPPPGEVVSDCPHIPAALTIHRVHGSHQHLVLKGSSSVLLYCSAGEVTVIPGGAAGSLSTALSLTSDGVLYTVVQDRQAVRISGFSLSSGSELVSRSLSVELPAADGEAVPAVRHLSVEQYSRRGDGEIAVRAFLVMEDHSVHLLAAPGLVWSREEALASILVVEALDLPVSASAVSMHDHSLHTSGIVGSLVQRVRAQSSAVLTWLAELLEGSLSGSGTSSSSESQAVLNRDPFNQHKLLIVATASGKLFALDNWTARVVWSSYQPRVRALPTGKMLLYLQRTVAHFPHPAQMALVAMQQGNCNAVVYTFNPLTGEPMTGGLQLLPYRVSQASMLHHNDDQFVKPVMVVDTELGVHIFPPSCEASAVLPHKDVLYVTMRNTTHLSGYSLRPSKPGALSLTPVWSSYFPPGVITGVFPKRSGDRLHSSGRVMADRSVLYKYNNPNLAVVLAQGHDNVNKNVLSVYLLDLVSGAVVDWISHRFVSGPVHVVHSENWVVYTYHNDKARRHEIHSLELFEGPTQANATAFSSLASLPQAPIVERQAYILPHGVQAASHTITEKSITNKFLLLALQTGGIAQIARWLVDPRRPLSSAGPREEGLMPYAPEVPIPPTEIISYNQTLPRVTGIFTGSTGLESTCIVFVYGLDLFFSRVFPSKMFDVLKDDFDYNLISAVLIGLVVAAIVTRKFAQRKALNQLWK
uniref:ER membrane protein complex subunit 1 n=1 Tax=Hirondellea gigas TaxID=1518452 RepID=A0A2P2I5T1_9CRUS